MGTHVKVSGVPASISGHLRWGKPEQASGVTRDTWGVGPAGTSQAVRRALRLVLDIDEQIQLHE